MLACDSATEGVKVPVTVTAFARSYMKARPAEASLLAERAMSSAAARIIMESPERQLYGAATNNLEQGSYSD